MPEVWFGSIVFPSIAAGRGLYSPDGTAEALRRVKIIKIKIADIYVPAALRVPIDAAKVEELALSIAGNGLLVPILVRADKDRYVLVGGRHRIAACEALGETTIIANLVQARKH